MNNDAVINKSKKEKTYTYIYLKKKQIKYAARKEDESYNSFGEGDGGGVVLSPNAAKKISSSISSVFSLRGIPE